MKDTKTFFRKIGAKICYVFVPRVMFVPKVYYENENLPKRSFENPSVVVSNHVYGVDGAMLEYCMKDCVLWSCIAKDMFKKWYVQVFTTIGHMIPIDRETPDWTFLKDTTEKIKQGDSVLIFPEGKASHNQYEMLDFKPGFIFISRMAESAPIVPIYVRCAYKRRLFQPFYIMIGEPITLNQPNGRVTREYLDAECERTKLKVEELSRLLDQRIKEKRRK